MGAHTHSRRTWPVEQQEQLRDLYARGVKDRDIAKAIGRPIKGVVNQRRKMGLFTPEQPVVIPEDFAQWAEGKTIAAIKRRLGVGYERAAQLRAAYNLPPVEARKKLAEAPADFPEVGPTLTLDACQRHYGRHYRVVRRWYDQAGIIPAPAPTIARKSVSWGVPRQSIYRADAETSLSSMAAQHLRRKGFSNIYRATILDKPKRTHLPDEGRHHYAVSGRGFMHEADVIALAAKHGFSVGGEMLA